jgi:2-polyprenyl-3-methyl-5-hydroxy-6-metoxy-1,4-benzoquinol methylase
MTGARPNACSICAGSLALFRRGSQARAESDGFAPTCHRPGAHADLYRCQECGTVQQPALPRGEPLLELYREMRDDGYLDEEAGRRQTAQRLLELLAPHVPTGRLLDVGSGHGLLVDEACRRGYRAEGLELSRAAAAHASERLGLSIREIPLEDPALDDERFDAIVLADVFEHLEDPVGALDRCTELLAPGGALMIVTPDPASATARIAGGRWWGYLPAHTFLVPRSTLRELIAARGLIVAEDVPLVRSFSPAYWLQGLAERGGRAGAVLKGLSRRLPSTSLSLSLGDERVMLARKVDVLKPARERVPDRGGPTKIHVVLPAYKAERTVGRVAAALPVEAADRALLVDDASPDGTVAAALDAGFEVLVHPTNRGYGANQKTCYVRAALDGADVVVMVHADNQYDPSLVAEMVKPIEAGEADVVIGSRLLEDKAISGGMPRWKWIGNRALTWVENRAFRREFSEYHTGYRAFSVPFLRTIPFLRNADGFVFDQQAFAQIVASQARVVELAIPTRYFLEASSVSFWRSVEYGLRTLGVLLTYRLDERRRHSPLLRRPAVELRPLGGPHEELTDSVSAR